MEVTRQLREASKAVDVELIDHVIVAQIESDALAKEWFSCRKAGLP